MGGLGLLASTQAALPARAALQLGPSPSLSAQLEGTTLRSPGVGWALTNKQRQLFYPDWLQGTWQAEARFLNASFPLGTRFLSRATPGVTKGSIIAALSDVGLAQERPVEMLMRWTYSEAEGGVVADRVYNISQQVDAFLGPGTLRSVAYDAASNPTRLAVVYATRRRDSLEATNDVRKAELFINNRTSEAPAPDVFVGAELYRQVNQAKQQGSIGDYLIISKYQRTQPDAVEIRQRVAAFLQPVDALYFEAGDQATALYDHAYTLKRVL